MEHIINVMLNACSSSNDEIIMSGNSNGSKNITPCFY